MKRYSIVLLWACRCQSISWQHLILQVNNHYHVFKRCRMLSAKSRSKNFGLKFMLYPFVIRDQKASTQREIQWKLPLSLKAIWLTSKKFRYQLSNLFYTFVAISPTDAGQLLLTSVALVISPCHISQQRPRTPTPLSVIAFIFEMLHSRDEFHRCTACWVHVNRKLSRRVTAVWRAIVGTNDVNTPSSSHQAII